MDLFRPTSPTYGELEQRNHALEPHRSARLPDPPRKQVADIIRKANPNKATGPDGTAIASWQAGGKLP